LWRDRAEINWDTDVDLGITRDQIGALDTWLAGLRSEGLSVKSRYYRGACYGYTLRDKKKPEILPVNIHIYDIDGQFAWSPQIVNWPFLREKGLAHRRNGSGLTYRFLSYVHNEAKKRREGNPLRRAWRWTACFPAWAGLVLLRNRMERQHWATVWPYSALYDVYTWVIPAKHFRELDTLNVAGVSIPVPSETEAYLTAHYGDWKTPVEEWVYWMDDGCIWPYPPETVLKLIDQEILADEMATSATHRA